MSTPDQKPTPKKLKLSAPIVLAVVIAAVIGALVLQGNAHAAELGLSLQFAGAGSLG